MTANLQLECPTYMELELKHGEVQTINGKEFTREGVRHVIDFIGQEAGVKADSVLHTLKTLKKENGSVKLQLFEGAVKPL